MRVDAVSMQDWYQSPGKTVVDAAQEMCGLQAASQYFGLVFNNHSFGRYDDYAEASIDMWNVKTQRLWFDALASVDEVHAQECITGRLSLEIDL